MVIHVIADSGDIKDSVIDAVDHHRNGVGGLGFYVALITEPDNSHKVVITVPDEPGATFVLDVDALAAGNIYMHPQVGADGNGVTGTGSNAWRGDHYREALHDKIVAAHDAYTDEQSARRAGQR